MRMIERVARAIYEADDAWYSAFPWPDLKEGRPRAYECWWQDDFSNWEALRAIAAPEWS